MTIKEFADGWGHFCKKVDFNASFLDAKAIQFMNEMPSEVAKTFQQRDDLLAACEGLIADVEMLEQDDGVTACQCLAKTPDDITEPPPCNYCKAVAAIAKAKT